MPTSFFPGCITKLARIDKLFKIAFGPFDFELCPYDNCGGFLFGNNQLGELLCDD